MFLRQFITIHSGLYQHYCSAISSLHLLDSRECKNAVLESKIVDCHVSARIVKGLKFLATHVDASPKAFSAWLNLDFTVSCDVTRERLAVLSQITGSFSIDDGNGSENVSFNTGGPDVVCVTE